MISEIFLPLAAVPIQPTWGYTALLISSIGLNLLIAIVVGIAAWSLSRNVKGLDGRLNAHDRTIDKLRDTLTEEVAARHESHKQLADKAWAIDAGVRENYMPRHEGLRLFGSIARRVEKVGTEMQDQLKSLPCRETQCPTKGGVLK